MLTACGHDNSVYSKNEDHEISEYIDIDDLKNHISKCICGYEKKEKHSFSMEDIISIKMMRYQDKLYYVIEAKCNACETKGNIFRCCDASIPLIEGKGMRFRKVTEEETINQLKELTSQGEYSECIGETGMAEWAYEVLNNKNTIFDEIIQE